jgi:hypothetical protein
MKIRQPLYFEVTSRSYITFNNLMDTSPKKKKKNLMDSFLVVCSTFFWSVELFFQTMIKL